METAISLNQIGLYNPQRQSDEITERLFVVRQKQFELLLNKITQEKRNSIPQHYLIIGQRGMGKTSILKRIEVELRKEQYRQQFIPLLFPEEQNNIRGLAELWLNNLMVLTKSLKAENYPDEKISDILKAKNDLSKEEPEVIADKAYKYLICECRELHRRPVLLIDNIGSVLGSMENKQEQWGLRKLLCENGAPIIVSAGVTAADDIINYNMPFYDFFQIQYLNKLNYEEFEILLKNLATVTHSDETVFTSIKEHSSRQKSLFDLTGGSPRTTVMLFKHIVKGFSSDINDDLETLADEITPLYKAKFEELPKQQQIIIDAIAMHWDAISFNKLSETTRLAGNQLSSQLKRLTDEGWIETVTADKESRKVQRETEGTIKGNAYSISERFFNIWYLLRYDIIKEGIYCLSIFLECFYGKEELEKMSDNILEKGINSPKQMRLYMAMSKLEMLDSGKREQIEDSINKALLESDELRNEVGVSEESLLEKFQTFDVNKITELTAKIKPKDAEFWENIGFTLLKNKKYEKSIICYNTAITINSNDSFTWYFKGYALNELQRYDEAIACCDKAIELYHENSFAWNSKCYALNKLQRHDEAIVCCDKAIELDPTVSYAWNNKGGSLIELQRYEEAIVCCDKAIELDPTVSYAWNNKGGALFGLQRYEEAIVCCDKAIELDPRNSSVWGNKGYALIELQRYEEAIICYDKAIELDQKNSYAWSDKGYALIELQRYEEAIVCYDKAIEFDPQNSCAWGDKGYALIGLKKYSDAVDAYEKSVKIDSKNLISKFHLLFLYRDKLGKTNKATGILYEIEKEINNDENVKFIPRFYLNKTLFGLHEKNQGIAKEHLLQAFEVLEKEKDVASIANKYWWTRFGSVVIGLGYGSWLLAILEEKGYDVVLSPYYTAIQALEIEGRDPKKGKENAETYLKNRAAEISAPARKIIDKMRRYMD